MTDFILDEEKRKDMQATSQKIVNSFTHDILDGLSDEIKKLYFLKRA